MAFLSGTDYLFLERSFNDSSLLCEWGLLGEVLQYEAVYCRKRVFIIYDLESKGKSLNKINNLVDLVPWY